ncbi:MAG: DUF3034 family protein [Holophaga sp.]|nr:DUF3034 family protein [Holophaga sp.]
MIRTPLGVPDGRFSFWKRTRSTMKRPTWFAAAVGVAVLVSGGVAHAGAPFVGLDGVGGIAFNPLAYLAGTPTKDCFVAKPEVGMWYIGLCNSSIDWTTYGIATSLWKRVEVSYGFETVDISKVDNVHKNTFGAKLLVVSENANQTKWIPAISLGAKRKNTSYSVGADTKSYGYDYYVVATKLVTQLPVPVLLSVGAQSTKEEVTGVIGFNKERKIIHYGNIDFIPVSWLCVGAEYRSGPDYGASGGNYKDADYFNLHAAYFASKQLSVAMAYTNAGKNTFNGGEGGSRLGFGGGYVLSIQYAF